MKFLILIAFVFLVACGGQSEEKSDFEIDVELCEAQDGRAELEIVDGEVVVICDTSDKKDREINSCKLNGSNCP